MTSKVKKIVNLKHTGHVMIRVNTQKFSWDEIVLYACACWVEFLSETSKISFPFSANTRRISTSYKYVEYAPSLDHVEQLCMSAPGRRAQVSLKDLSITVLVAPLALCQFRFTALFGFKPELLFSDLSYINMQPHFLHTYEYNSVCVCVACMQTHTQIILNVYTDWLEHRSDKAYLIRERSSLNQV